VAAFAAMHGPELLYLIRDPWRWGKPMRLMRRRSLIGRLGAIASIVLILVTASAAADEQKIALCHAGLITLPPFAQLLKERKASSRDSAEEIKKLDTPKMAPEKRVVEAREETPKAQAPKEGDPEKNVDDWEIESRTSVPNPRKRVPAAQALVLRANDLLRGSNPSCSAMKQAAKLLDKADDLYIKAGAFDGDVRTVGRRVSWLEDKVKAGKCRR